MTDQIPDIGALRIEDDTSDIVIQNMEGLAFLSTLEDDSVDLILTDPPLYYFKREWYEYALQYGKEE